jgi:hypothetical protein
MYDNSFTLNKSRVMVRTDQLDRSMFTHFADWYQNKDYLNLWSYPEIRLAITP